MSFERSFTEKKPESPIYPVMFNIAGSTLTKDLSEPTRSQSDLSLDTNVLAEPKPLSARAVTPQPLIRFDPGWLFLLSGIVLIAAVLLIPARHDLAEARWQRDRALAIESHRTERLARYGQYLSALQSNDECVLMSLAALQLNLSPENRVPIGPMPDLSRTSASVFPNLEPGPVTLPPDPNAADSKNLSILERLTINNSSRLWIIAAGTMCVLFGLLPGTSKAAAAVAASATTATFHVAAAAVGEANQTFTRLKAESLSRTQSTEQADLDNTLDDPTDHDPTDESADEVDLEDTEPSIQTSR